LIRPAEDNNTLVQKAATPAPSKADTAAAAAKAKAAAMSKYLAIARQLVKLDASLPTLKLCMADVQAGKYKPGTAAKIQSGKSGVPKALKDPATGKPFAIIVDNKGENLIDLAHSSIVGGGKKPLPAKTTINLSTAAAKPTTGDVVKTKSEDKVSFGAKTKKLIAAKTLTKAQISDEKAKSDPGCFKKAWMTVTCRHGKMEKEVAEAKAVIAAHKALFPDKAAAKKEEKKPSATKLLLA